MASGRQSSKKARYKVKTLTATHFKELKKTRISQIHEQ